MKRYPSGTYGRQRLEFHPAPFRAPLRAFAGLVFAWRGDQVLVCDIDGRGWCIPSGRVEPNESSLEAVRREALEEGGALLECIQYIGCYRITEKREVRWADCYAARVHDLVEITMREESKDRKLVHVAELPAIYHLWNPLTEMLFELSYEVVCRSSVGESKDPLSELKRTTPAPGEIEC
jgi:8-oxo-dGTP diphosphatase